MVGATDWIRRYDCDCRLDLEIWLEPQTGLGGMIVTTELIWRYGWSHRLDLEV